MYLYPSLPLQGQPGTGEKEWEQTLRGVLSWVGAVVWCGRPSPQEYWPLQNVGQRVLDHQLTGPLPLGGDGEEGGRCGQSTLSHGKCWPSGDSSLFLLVGPSVYLAQWR